MRVQVVPCLAAAAALLLAGAVRAVDAPPKTAELTALGASAFAKRCAPCHGGKGEGDGVAAKALKQRPRNLVTEPLRNGSTVTQVFATITTGVQGTAMAPFKHLPEEERWALAYFVLGLREGAAAPAKQ
jgi:mono/diheme cytochrome c family protein